MQTWTPNFNIPELTFPSLCCQLRVGGPVGFALSILLPFESVWKSPESERQKLSVSLQSTSNSRYENSWQGKKKILNASQMKFEKRKSHGVNEHDPGTHFQSLYSLELSNTLVTPSPWERGHKWSGWQHQQHGCHVQQAHRCGTWCKAAVGKLLAKTHQCHKHALC